MSTVKSNRSQLGISGTATQNFTLTAEAADGTMKLARGNAGATTQDVITVDANGLVTFDQGTQIPSGASTSASGTAVDFTGIPSWVRRITIGLSGISTNGSSITQFQLGDSGGVETTGYLGAVDSSTTAVSAALLTTGLGVTRSGTAGAGSVFNGVATFILIDSATNLWAGSWIGARSDSAACLSSGTSKALSGTLDRIRLTTVNGTDTFDAGTINILYE